MGADVESIYYQDIPKYFEKYLPIVDMIQLDLAKNPMIGDGKKFDYIIYLSGYAQPAKFLANPNATISLNTTAILNIFNFLKPNGKFLFVSSDAVYTGAPYNPYTENMNGRMNLEDPRIPYIESKRMGEVITKINGGIIARLSYVYGPGGKLGDSRVINEFIQRAISDKKLKISDGSAVRSWLYVSDAILMLCKILFFGIKGNVYNIANIKNNEMSILDVAKEICKLTNVPLEVKNQNTIVDKSAPNEMSLSIDKYTKAFGNIEFTNFSDGLKNTISWYEEIIDDYKTC
jgi:nucleoside-diphosphate-sugar epimerase